MDSGTDSPSIFSASMFENVGREETVTTENQLKENEYPRYVVLFVLKSQFASTVTPFKETWYGCSPIGVKFARFFFLCAVAHYYGTMGSFYINLTKIVLLSYVRIKSFVIRI